jgi:hypothetical protein
MAVAVKESPSLPSAAACAPIHVVGQEGTGRCGLSGCSAAAHDVSAVPAGLGSWMPRPRSTELRAR